MKKLIFVVLGSFVCLGTASGASPATAPEVVRLTPTVVEEGAGTASAAVAASVEARSTGQMDSMLVAMSGEGSVAAFERFFDEFIQIDSTVVVSSATPDSVYQRRLKSILSPIGLPWNDVVKRYIVAYTTTRRATMANILNRSQYYFPIIEQELAAAGLPLELRMLAAIESALVPGARSRVGATGLWQFMLPTAREYGLEVTTFIDQRRDPVASTRAACRYLANMYRVYGDWGMVMAAYNCGPGNVNKALRRAGAGAKTYWDIYPFLPAETRGYIPSFIAATYTYAFHKQHGIEIPPRELPVAVDTIQVRRLMHLDQVATTLEIPLETLQALNPQYIKDIVPALDKTYAVILPQTHATTFVGRAEEIHGKDSLYLAQYLNPANLEQTKAILTATSTVHRVRSGENLGVIARRYGVTQSQIVKWNNLRNPNRLSIGQRLEIQK